MKKVFDKAINQEKEEQKTASEVPIQRIIKKIRIMKKRDKHNELLELLRKNEVELNKTESGIFSVITSPQRKERQALLDKQLPLVAEYLCILKKISPSSDKGAAKLRSADSWPDYPDFDTQESDTDESDSDESDSDEKTYEEFPKMEDSKFTGTEDFKMHVFQQQSFF
ncbi:uncharacterized protein LOC122856251 [Aphidius gifuensis]|uniref:uncharacterized protein LOC122856251 n=1 Tax=Aphidius gifuensis TaxID=684658 RepID=UPI001CDCD018|nr:uncharacterized protein LOC122856251 [Aphidius gifuensis]